MASKSPAFLPQTYQIRISGNRKKNNLGVQQIPQVIVMLFFIAFREPLIQSEVIGSLVH